MTFRDAGEGDLAFLLDGLADNRAIEGHPSPSITDASNALCATDFEVVMNTFFAPSRSASALSAAPAGLP